MQPCISLPGGRCGRAGRWSSMGPADPCSYCTPSLPAGYRVDTATAGLAAWPTPLSPPAQTLHPYTYLQARGRVM